MKAPVSRRHSLAALAGFGAAVITAACDGSPPSRTRTGTAYFARAGGPAAVLAANRSGSGYAGAITVGVK